MADTQAHALEPSTSSLHKERPLLSSHRFSSSGDDHGHEAIELGILTPSTSTTSLPMYESVVDVQSTSSCSVASPDRQSSFRATTSLQIESRGMALVRLPVPPRPDPVHIYAVSPTGDLVEPVYTSLRAGRSSGNSILVRADDAEHKPLCTTTYRFGPNRPPQIRLHADHISTPSPDLDEEISVLPRGHTTRAQLIRTPLGTFSWRFADRRERKELSADSLLVMERITSVALAGGKSEERRQRVAHLIRNDEYRSVGSARSTAGNGGRLAMDLRAWADSKGEAEQMEVLVVASCLVMLKKEMDRRRLMQAAMIVGCT
ncbi:hypothetical protein S40293_03319 [Stachybotrys chartarum IBT 40293]|nr:hypothetical protein S40293_03319 [Stachybotrys chartarum IBT 40293]